MDIAAKPDDIAKTQIIKELKQLWSPNHDPQGSSRRNRTAKVPSLATGRHPPSRCAASSVDLSRPSPTAVACHRHAESPVRVSPAHRGRSRSSPSQQRCLFALRSDIDVLVAEQPVDLLDRVLGDQTACLCQSLSNPCHRPPSVVITPNVAPAKASILLACRSCSYRPSMKPRTSFKR